MRIKNNFVLQMITDEFLVVPIGEEANRLNGVIKLNETGAFLWNYLVEGVHSKAEMETVIMKEYGIDYEKAYHDVGEFLRQIESLGCLED